MMKTLLFIWCLIHLIKAYEYNYCQAPGVVPSIETEGLTLAFVQALSRHGDRAPTSALPHVDGDNVAWNCQLNELTIASDDTLDSIESPSRLYRKLYIEDRELLSPGNCAAGQLTEIGWNQTVLLGEQLIDQYALFLPDSFDPELIYIRSTDVPRTIKSAEGQFIGMYPPSNGDQFTSVIEIHTMDADTEDMYPNPLVCPALVNAYNRVMSSSAWVTYMAQWASFQQKLQAIFDVTEDLDFQDLAGALYSRLCHGLALPPGITNDIVDQLMEISNWQLAFLTNDTQASILGSGLFLQELIHAIDNFIAGQQAPIYILYSGHDTVLAPLLGALESFDGQWPPYVSNMQIELWVNNTSPAANDYFIEIKYNGEYIKVPACSSVMCNYAQEFRPFAITKVPTPKDCAGDSFSRKLFFPRNEF